jgi:DNA/RNA endonuclease YhcR with UshA esterase domain
MQRSTLAVAAAAAVLAFACTEASAPAGKTGTLTVRAYIDRDRSGTYSTVDSALVGIVVTLSTGATQTGTQTTIAGGVATFADLKPGSYSVSAPTTAVAGGTLTSNPTPAAVISFQGKAVSLEFVYAFYPGEVSGVVYRDDNANGALDASDTRGAGLFVYAKRDNNGVSGALIDSTATGADGTYRFALVPPGSYFIEFQNPATISYGTAGTGASRRVVVAPQAVVTASATYTGSLILNIVDVRAKTVGSIIAVQANVTVRPGTFPIGTTANSEVWVQDATGGIAVVNVPTVDSLVYALGDRVEVSGPTSLFSGQLQIASTKVTKLSSGTPVVPKILTVAQATARVAADEGRLITLSNVTVTTIGTGTAAAFNVTVRDAAGDSTTVRVNGLPTGLTRANFAVNNRYNVTGVLTQFNGTSQMKPRTPADLVLAAAITPIGTVRAAVAGATFTVNGNVTVAPGAIVSGTGFVTSEIWVQDATGGIAAFSAPTADSTTLKVGDRIEVTGVLGAFSGQVQLGSAVYTRIGTGTAPAPKVITGTAMNAKTDDGLLVQLDNFTVTIIATGTATAFNVTGTTPDGQTVVVRVGGALTGLSRTTFVVGNTYRIVGALSQNGGIAQIKVRTRSDITP